MTALVFDVNGVPAPQGGSRAVPTAKGARLISTGGKNLSSWRNDFTAAAISERLQSGWETSVGAVLVGLQFRFPMPASRPKSARVAGRVLRTTKPDIDKLCRAALDALTAAAVIRDDAQVAVLLAGKAEVLDEWVGCAVSVVELNAERDVAGLMTLTYGGLVA